MCFALIAARALPAEPVLLGCSPAAPTLCRSLRLLFKTSADGELAGNAGIATRGSGARRGEGGPASPGGVGGSLPRVPAVSRRGGQSTAPSSRPWHLPEWESSKRGLGLRRSLGVQ